MTESKFINIGGKERRLRFDINSAAEMEELLGGQSLLFVMSNPAAAGFRVLRILLWGGLKHAEKGLTLQRVGIMMQEYMENGGSTEEIAEAVAAAIRASKIMGNMDEPAEPAAANDGDDGKE